MVCTYCGSSTKVTNSRHQKRHNTVWRRRQCEACRSIVTTEEAIRYDSALMLQHKDGRLEPFSRDTLLISLYKSLAHRKTAAEDASALSNTVMAALREQTGATPIIDLNAVVRASTACLERFDAAAGSHYRSYHPIG